MDFYTAFVGWAPPNIRGCDIFLLIGARSHPNGIVGQGITQTDAISKLQEAIESFQEVYESEDNIYLAPVSIKELHEFLTIAN